MTKATKERTREYVNLGLRNYGIKGNMWETEASNGEKHFISAHLNPMLDPMGDPVPLLMCSCRSFTIGIPASRENPFITPCKHIQGFDVDKEVDIETLECNRQR